MTADLAALFARLRYGAESEFSTLFTPEQCRMLLEATAGPSNWRASYFAMREDRDIAVAALKEIEASVNA